MPAEGLFSFVGSPAGRELISWCPSRSPRLLERLRDKPHVAHGTIIDVGSFDGNDAVNYARASGLPVWTFEPTPSKHAGIRKVIKARGLEENVTLYPYALSNRTGEAQLELFMAPLAKGRHFMQGKPGSAQDFLLQDARPEGVRENKALINVPIRRLDDLLNVDATIPYMKVDAQGFDTLVLRGANRALLEHRVKTFSFEFSPFLMPGRFNTARTDLAWLETLGYSCCPCRGNAAPRMTRVSMTTSQYVDMYERKGHADARKPRTQYYDDVICRVTSNM